MDPHQSSLEVPRVLGTKLDGERIGVVLQCSSDPVRGEAQESTHGREEVRGEEEGDDGRSAGGGRREAKRGEEGSVGEEEGKGAEGEGGLDERGREEDEDVATFPMSELVSCERHQWEFLDDKTAWGKGVG